MKVKTLTLDLGDRRYDITIGRGMLSKAGEVFRLNRKVFILTDSGVPAEYAKAVAAQCKESKIVTVAQGEDSKSMETLNRCLQQMLDYGLTRSDCCVAVGGGVVGDLTGFLSAVYMRGIDFYNVPTTLLSCLDSSIGGKTAINFGGVKNIVGAFHQPRHVLIDPNTLKTLDKRQFSAGLAEGVKMGLTSDETLFSLFETRELTDTVLDEIILKALLVKKSVVEQDEQEAGLRKILNFGHTLGHGIESLGGLLHGECVALGMLPMCAPQVRNRLIPVLEKLNLPTRYSGDLKQALEPVVHDKKCVGTEIEVIYVPAVGSFQIRRIPVSEFQRQVAGECQ